MTGLTAGVKYRFQYYAVNDYGDSEASSAISIAASALPSAPNTPSVDYAQSSLTSLYIDWDEVADPDSPVIGYILHMDDGQGGDFSEIYDGSYAPGITHFEKTGLTTGLQYKFIVYAANYNGWSAGSNEGSFYVCDEPSSFAAPYLTDQSTTQLDINWSEPGDTGGCSITGYAIYRDDGANGSIDTEVNSANDANVRDLPSLNSFAVTNFPSSSEGNTFRF